MHDFESSVTEPGLDFPTRAAELTRTGLASALREAGWLGEGEEIAGHRFEKINGQGLTADVARIQLDCVGARGARSETLVAKFASANKNVRALYAATGTYEREVRFYQTFGRDAGISTPGCYAAEIDPKSGHFFLLLEDLGKGRIGEAGSVEDVELAIKHLATFHARWWGVHEMNEYAWLANPAEPLLHDVSRGMWEGLLATFKAKYSEGAHSIVLEVAELIAKFWDRLVPSPGTVLTLSHSDYRPGQLFFASERGGRFAVTDWQTVSIEPPGVDLAKIVVTGLGIRQRRKLGRQLVENYHRVLLAHGVACFDLSTLWHQYRIGLLSILVANLSALVVLEGRWEPSRDSGAGVDFDRYFAQVAVALEDYQVLDLMHGLAAT